MEPSTGCLALLLFSTLTSLSLADIFPGAGQEKSVVFRSPAFTLAPGGVLNAYYFDADFVKGHIGIKAFNAELADEHGNSVPLNELYLHHWVASNYLRNTSSSSSGSSIILLGDDAVCPGQGVTAKYGVGSETRRTNSHLPGPYAVEVGHHENEEWFLNVHAIDLRGTVNPLGCLECHCDLYNVTVRADGQPLEDGYKGGLACCYNGTHCQVKDGYAGENRTYYLQYTVHYLDWDDRILPVKFYVFDATYNGTVCKVEYDVPACSSQKAGTSECTHVQESVLKIPVSGDVIYGASHQHVGGTGSAIYGQDGREICRSVPIYGNGTEPGNEAGYLVGMTTCYPEPGSVSVRSGESIRMLSNYSSSTMHLGVMGLGYVAVYSQ